MLALVTALVPVILAWTPLSPPFGNDPCLRGPFRGVTQTNEIGEVIGEPDRADWGCVGDRRGGGRQVREQGGLLRADEGTNLDGGPVGPPTSVCFKEAFPNPATNEARLTILLPAPTHVIVTLYAQSLQHGPRAIAEVRKLLDADLVTGTHQLLWDLEDADGARVPPGIYRAVLRAGDQSLCGDIEVR